MRARICAATSFVSGASLAPTEEDKSFRGECEKQRRERGDLVDLEEGGSRGRGVRAIAAAPEVVEASRRGEPWPPARPPYPAQRDEHERLKLMV